MLGIALFLSFASLSVVMGASVVVSRPMWVDRAYLALAFGLLGTGLVANLIWVLFWISPTLGSIGSITTLVACCFVVAAAGVWRCWQAWLPTVLLSAGVCAALSGFVFLWGNTNSPFGLEVTRFSPLPSDNMLQHVFADRLWKGRGTTDMLSGWNGSDRPPLQSGLLLLVRPLGRLMGIPHDAPQFGVRNMQLGAAMSLVTQVLWVPAAQCLLRTLRFKQTTAAITILFCASTPFIFRNTTFTWPKMMAAAFALAAIALLVNALLSDQGVNVADLVSAAVLTLLAFLSHSGVVFIAPLMLILVVMVIRRSTARTVSLALMLSAALCVISYIPWVLYARYADPTDNRLLKWHLAGVENPTNTGLIQTLVHSYRHTPVSTLIANRGANLHRIVYLGLSDRLDFGPDWTGRSRALDFYYPTIALGFGSLLTAGLLGWALYARLRRRSLSQEMRLGVILVLGSLLSVLAWGLVLFEPTGSVPHQGSYVWFVLPLVIPFAFLFDHLPVVAWLVLATSLAYTLPVYLAPSAGQVTSLNEGWLIAAVVGILTAAGAALAMGDRRSGGGPRARRRPAVDVGRHRSAERAVVGSR